MKLKGVLSGAFSLAIEEGYLSANPVREVKLKRVWPLLTGERAVEEQTHAYTLTEIQHMLAVVPKPARTVIAVAASTGLRRGEIRGLDWADYAEVEFVDEESGRAMKTPAFHVRRSIWNGHVTAPKTANSTAHVPVIPHSRRYSKFTGSIVQSGMAQRTPNFPHPGRSSPMKAARHCAYNLAQRVIVPHVKHCNTCGSTRAEHDEKPQKFDHAFIGDKSRDLWSGWHAFRRGLGSTLNRMGVDDSVIMHILGHSDVRSTQKHCIKTLPSDAVAAMQQFEQKAREFVQ